VKLINTIEINPYAFANTEYESPNGSWKDLPDAWDEFWRRCLADKNLENLQAIRKGSYLVDIEAISQKELEAIIKNELEGVDLEDYEEQVGIICGGIVVKVEDRFLIEPSCCGDIGNIVEWENIFTNENPNWKQLWIGHPWIFYRNVNGVVEFSDYYEANIEDVENVKSLMKVSVNDLKAQLKTIKAQQIEFENKIQDVLVAIGLQNSKQIAKLMTGNE